ATNPATVYLDEPGFVAEFESVISLILPDAAGHLEYNFPNGDPPQPISAQFQADFANILPGGADFGDLLVLDAVARQEAVELGKAVVKDLELVNATAFGVLPAITLGGVGSDVTVTW